MSLRISAAIWRICCSVAQSEVSALSPPGTACRATQLCGVAAARWLM
jgi:hypothetical protein